MVVVGECGPYNMAGHDKMVNTTKLSSINCLCHSNRIFRVILLVAKQKGCYKSGHGTHITKHLLQKENFS